MKFTYTKEKIQDLVDQLGRSSGNSGTSEAIKDSNSGSPLKIWTGTQEEYDLVLDKDPSTLYVVKYDYADYAE